MPRDVVVGEHPGRRRVDRRVRRERAVDHAAQPLRIPRAREELEVERRVQLSRPQVAREALAVRQPDLADQDPVVRVALRDRAPRAVDLVQLVAVDVRVGVRRLCRVEVGQPAVLEEERSRVDADAGGAAVEPEAQHVLVLAPHVRVAPVEVRLLGREQVQVPLARASAGVRRARPRAAAEDRAPVVRRELSACAAPGPEPEALPLGRAGARGECRPEPRVPVGAVVRDDVDDDADSEVVSLGDQLLGLAEGAEHRIDVAVIVDVVAAVRHRGRVPGVEPDRVDPEPAEVGQPRAHARDVAGAVAVAVGEAAQIDLVDGGVPPPGPAARTAESPARRQRARGPGHPLSAPACRPPRMWRWKRRKNAIIGALAIARPA